SGDNCARIFPVAGGKPVTLSGHTGPILCIEWSADGRRILTGSRDWRARVWNSDGSGAPQVLEGHTDSAVLVAFGPDDYPILTIGDDGATRVWRKDGLSEVLITDDMYSAVGISRDCKHIVTVLEDESETKLVWELELEPAKLIERLRTATPFRL